MSDIAKELGLRIRQLRNEKHMSQEELSFKAGISPAHLGQIERAVKNPTIDTIAKISSALDIPVTMLFSAEHIVSAPQNLTIGKINAQLIDMSEEEQKDILRIIRIFRNYHNKNTLPAEPD